MIKLSSGYKYYGSEDLMFLVPGEQDSTGSCINSKNLFLLSQLLNMKKLVFFLK